MYCGPHRNKKPRWVPATVIKVNGTRNVNVRVYPRGPVWRRHVEQLRPRYGAELDKDPPELPTCVTSSDKVGQHPLQQEQQQSCQPPRQSSHRRNPRLPDGDEYGSHNPRRSERLKKV